MDWTKKRTGWAAVAVAVVTGVCTLAVTARDNLPAGEVQKAAVKVCRVCELAGVLQADGGVRELDAPAARHTALVREGMGWRPVLLPAGAAQPGGSATVEELSPEGEETGRTAPLNEAPPAFR